MGRWTQTWVARGWGSAGSGRSQWDAGMMERGSCRRGARHHLGQGVGTSSPGGPEAVT